MNDAARAWVHDMSRRVRHPCDYRRVIVRTFVCPVCGAVVPATKTQGITVAGHIKTMWCYSCREVRDFLQVDRVEEIRKE